MAIDRSNETGKNGIFARKYYSHVLINKAKRWFLIVAVLFLGAVLTFVLFTNMLLNKSWFLSLVPVGIIGFFATLLPSAEDWVYEPWQSKPRVYEQEK